MLNKCRAIEQMRIGFDRK